MFFPSGIFRVDPGGASLHSDLIVENNKEGFRSLPKPFFVLLAGPMGFEPTPSDVTGRRYNQT
jgi:hypothetical protein